MPPKKLAKKKPAPKVTPKKLSKVGPPIKVPPELLACVPPGWSLRPIQARALVKAWEALKNPAFEYVVLEAPPGVGKSLLAITLARYFRQAALCTLTVQLQEQYVKDFEAQGLRVLKGRRNFRCASYKDTCETGGKYGKCHGCPYVAAKNAALAAPICAANYHSFWFHMPVQLLDDSGEPMELVKGEDGWDMATATGGRRQLLILDEAHGLEGVVMDMASVAIKLSDLPIPLPPFPDEARDPAPYYEWLERVTPDLTDLAKEYDSTGRHDDYQKLSRLLVKVYGVLKSVKEPENREQAAEWTPTEYIVGRGTLPGGKELDPSWFELKPLHVRHMAKRYWQGFPKTLFMSATILNAGEFVKALGLDPAKGEFVQIEESFPPENRPIMLGQLDMRFAAREESWPAMAQIVNNLLGHHATEKGLILVQSGEMMKYLMKHVQGRARDRLIPAFGTDRLQRYEEHVRRKDPTVLVAPGYWEGADLKDDLSRFAIIPACPRAQWAGQVAARAKNEPDWYRWLTFTKLIQGLGRSVRSETDEAVTYILDKEFLTEMNRRNSMIPPWVKAAVKLPGEGA